MVGFISNKLTIVTMNDKCYRNYVISETCPRGPLSWRTTTTTAAAAAAAATTTTTTTTNVIDYSAVITHLRGHFTKSRYKTVAQLNADVC